MRDGVPDSLGHQALGIPGAHRLDADSAALTDFRREIVRQELAHTVGFVAARLVLDPRIDVLDVLAEDDHVEGAGVFHGRRHALEPPNRTHAGIQVQKLAQRDVQRPNAPSHRRGEGPLDGDAVLPDRVERSLGQPLAGLIVRLLSGHDLLPHNLPVATIRAGHRLVEYVLRGTPQVRADAVAFYEGDDRVVRDDVGAILPIDMCTRHGIQWSGV